MARFIEVSPVCVKYHADEVGLGTHHLHDAAGWHQCLAHSHLCTVIGIQRCLTLPYASSGPFNPHSSVLASSTAAGADADADMLDLLIPCVGICLWCVEAVPQAGNHNRSWLVPWTARNLNDINRPRVCTQDAPGCAAIFILLLATCSSSQPPDTVSNLLRRV